MKKIVDGVVDVVRNGKAAVVAVGTTVTGMAHATLPTGADAAFTTLAGDATTLAGYAFPALLTVLGFIVAFKLTKRFGNHI